MNMDVNLADLCAAIAGADADSEALREHSRQALAGYKVPARIVFVPVVVRSPSGKADYRWARSVLAGTQNP